MPGSDPRAVEIKAFVPSRDFELSKRFYAAIGFTVAGSSDGLADVRHGETGFLLQDFFVEEHAPNFQMHLLVSDADDWHRRILASGAADAFGVAIGEPEDRPWGMRDFTLFDPSGVLWRIGHAIGG